MVSLRDYQAELISSLRATYAAGKRAPLLVLATGGGKTFCFSFMTKAAVAKGNRVLILVHRRELLDQASRSLSALGVEHGLIAPGSSGEREPVAVGSIQTVDRRLKKASLDFNFIIIDEAHHVGAASWRRVIDAFPNAKILGVTATPIRLDGKGLNDCFDSIVLGPSTKKLISLNYLVGADVYAPPIGNALDGVRSRMGDFIAKELVERFDKPTITGSAVEHYEKHSRGRPAIAFCISIEHANHVRDAFRAAGFRSETIHGGVDDEARRKMIVDLGRGDLDVLTSIDVISEGTDIPIVETAILLRPTKSLGLYIQQVGRVLRTSDSKSRALILDHAGNCLRHGLPDDHRDWTLEGIKKASSNNRGPSLRQCEMCFHVYSSGNTCPKCGHSKETKERTIDVVDGELQKVTAADLARIRKQKQMRREEAAARTLEDLRAIERARGYKSGWAEIRWAARERRGNERQQRVKGFGKGSSSSF